MGRVLVVDDEQSLRDVLEILVTSKGHNVVTAKSVDEAREIIRTRDLDLVITDLRLEPRGDGRYLTVRPTGVSDNPNRC